MRHVSFRVFILCILLPPVLYIFSLQALEFLLEGRWTAELQKVLISDTHSLLQGQISIDDEIQRNIERHLDTHRYLLNWGVTSQISVRTETGRWLYPLVAWEMSNLPAPAVTFTEEAPVLPSPPEVARTNMRIMDEGIHLSLRVQIPRNTRIANGILISYLTLFSLIFYRNYHLSTREIERKTLQHRRALEAASEKLRVAEGRLQDVASRERNYQQEMKELQAELRERDHEVRTIEEESLTEMENMEKRLCESIALRENIEKEVVQLRKEVEKYEAASRTPDKRREKHTGKEMKRLRTLYRRLDFHPRAVEGYLNLLDDMQLKAEELIRNIDKDTTLLSAKRKVFSRKGSPPVFECEFGYRGRIYWRHGGDGKVQVVAIGTKNTQERDLTFLETLERM